MTSDEAHVIAFKGDGTDSDDGKQCMQEQNH